MGTSLSDKTGFSNGKSIYVSDGGDVYVAGHESSENGDVAKLWKNGIPILLSDGSNNAYALSVNGSDTDVYVVGY